MDFGQVGLEGFAGSDSASTTCAFASDAEIKQKWYGSGLALKHERSVSNEDEWRSSKLPKTEDFSAKAILLRSNGSVFSDGQQQMLCFSAPKSETGVTFPYLNRNSGYSTGNFNGGNMHGVRGPFTTSQWMELEQQALIYKYISANVPIPSNLLIPIRKPLDSAHFSAFPGGLLRPNTSLGWGAFHLGFANSNDPEPGRCRRTDGKKWRCSRDAVADQKYCERHMNRGRHRSRKPVEGQSGHPVAASPSATSGPTPKLTPSTLVPSLGSAGGGSGATNSVAIAQQQLKNLQSGAVSNLSHNRMFLNEGNVGETTGGLSKENPFLFPKQQLTFEETSMNEFGVVFSDSLLNPSNKSSTLINCRNFGSAPNLSDQETEPQHSLRQFMDDWPKIQSVRSAISWPEVETRSNKTQLSISPPMAASDFMSSTSSPTKGKLTLSPLRLSRELNPVQMGLGTGGVINEPYQRQANWIPISWETSMGGPLGEVLHNSNNSAADCKKSSALNLMTDGWDNSPRLGSSPTGVLQKSSFNSLSNSSAGSSPRAENSKNFCEDLLGSSLTHSASLPAL